MSFPIDTTIPNENNDPIDDVPLIRGNFNNTNSYLKVDHVEAGAPGNGYHKQVTYFNVASPGSPVGNTSVGYTALGSAAPAVPEGRFVNSIGTFPTTAIRACANFLSNNTMPLPQNITLLNSFNIVSVIRTGSNTYQITLQPNIVNGNFPIVFLTTDNAVDTYTYSANVITFSPSTFNGGKVNLLVLQI